MISFIKKHKFDIILISAICFIALSVFLIFELTKTKGNFVVVEVNGKEIATYPLGTDGVYTIGNKESYNILVVENGFAYISKASCPDKFCEHQRKISFNNEQLVCLPNKTIITVVSNKQPITDF